MFILRIFSKQHIFILDRTYSSASVGPDLGAADVEGEDEKGKRNFGSEIDGFEVRIKGADERKDNHEKLKKSN